MPDTKTPPPIEKAKTASGETKQEKFLDYLVLMEAVEDSIEQRVVHIREQAWGNSENKDAFIRRYNEDSAKREFDRVFAAQHAPRVRRSAGLEGLSNSEAFVEKHGDGYTGIIRSLLEADRCDFTLLYGQQESVEVNSSKEGSGYKLMIKSDRDRRRQVGEISSVREGADGIGGLDAIFSGWKWGGSIELGTVTYSTSRDDGERSCGYLKIGTFRYRIIQDAPFALATLAKGLQEIYSTLEKVDAIRYKPNGNDHGKRQQPL